ncbi:alpha/beta fold hydrolase [Novosphingopyxis sp.]|uniref:alpha/beta fold hydrolase n=1 Tax=Novosphingopyxis sp. TaxID=2709690 RepID=UPI003B5BB8AA
MKTLLATLAAPAALLAFASPAAAAAAPTDCPAYETEGSGPDVLLVPGLASSPETYDGLVDALKGKYRFHRVAIAGFAGRDPVAGDPVDAAEAEILRYADCAHLTSPALIGHSLGGFVGQEIARDHPGLLSKLVIVDALPFYSLIFDPAATVEGVTPQADALAATLHTMDDATFAAGQARTATILSASPEGQTKIVAWSLASDRDAMADAVHKLMTTDLRPDLPGITLPVTVLYATNPYLPATQAKALFEGAYAGLPGVSFVPVTDSRHFIMFDQPERFAEAIATALGE